MKEISATDLKQGLARGDDIQIIDVREPNEYEVAHLENSKLILHGEIGSRVSEIDRARDARLLPEGRLAQR